MATHSSIPAWKIPRTEEPGGLQSTGSQRVRKDWASVQHIHTHSATKGRLEHGAWIIFWITPTCCSLSGYYAEPCQAQALHDPSLCWRHFSLFIFLFFFPFLLDRVGTLPPGSTSTWGLSGTPLKQTWPQSTCSGLDTNKNKNWGLVKCHFLLVYYWTR